MNANWSASVSVNLDNAYSAHILCHCLHPVWVKWHSCCCNS